MRVLFITTARIWDGGSIAADVSSDTGTTYYVRGINLLWSVDSDGSATYYVYNAHGDVVGLVGGAETSYRYDAFGRRTDWPAIGIYDETDQNPFRYCGEYYDEELGYVYLRARYYEPATGRFVTEDPAKDGTNWYVYCGGNPVVFVDSTGYWPSLNDILDGAKKIFKLASQLWRSLPPSKLFTALTRSGELDGFLSTFLGADKDSNGIYHIRQDYWQSWNVAGYNPVYDFVFDFYCSMDTKIFDFMVGDTKFQIQAWKGEYYNLGAGAEVGIYYDPLCDFHWKTGTQYAMQMSLSLRDKDGNEIFSWSPAKEQWWITGFSASRQGVNPSDLTMYCTINFSGQKDLWEAFYAKYNGTEYWTFDPDFYKATFKW